MHQFPIIHLSPLPDPVGTGNVSKQSANLSNWFESSQFTANSHTLMDVLTRLIWFNDVQILFLFLSWNDSEAYKWAWSSHSSNHFKSPLGESNQSNLIQFKVITYKQNRNPVVAVFTCGSKRLLKAPTTTEARGSPQVKLLSYQGPCIKPVYTVYISHILHILRTQRQWSSKGIRTQHITRRGKQIYHMARGADISAPDMPRFIWQLNDLMR